MKNKDGKVKEVKFGIVLNNLDKNHSISCECKSGRTEPGQLKKYSMLTSEELVRVGGIFSNELTLHTHDISIVFNEST